MVVVGGLLSTLSLTLLALPNLYYLMNRRRGEPHNGSRVPVPDELQADSVDPAEETQRKFWQTKSSICQAMRISPTRTAAKR
jgi:hypothetical protein